MKKLLIMGQSIPPSINATAIIIRNLASQFTPDEMVILGAYVPDSPPHDWQATQPKLIYTVRQSKNPSRRQLWIQFPSVLMYAIWTIRAEGCQAILVIFPDETQLLAAYLTSLIWRKPLFVYLHNTYLENYRSKLDPQKWFPTWLQNRVFRRAQHIFVISQAMQRFYQKHYPDLETTPLPHSFQEPIPMPPPTLTRPAPPYQFILLGNINYTNQDAVLRLRDAVQQLPSTQLTLYNRTSSDILAVLGLANFQHPPVSREVLLQHLAQADILILPHGFHHPKIDPVEIQTIFPTRTIEYLISGKPILAHLPTDCFLADFLRQHQCAYLVTEPTVEAVFKGLHTLLDDADLRVRLVKNALLAAEQFQASHVANYLRQTIEGVSS